jgi:hypothetical protein
LKIEGENLEEKMFDMEQQIVGIDLEVEKRLSEHIKSLGHAALPQFPPPTR